jgi:hypothetical protein
MSASAYTNKRNTPRIALKIKAMVDLSMAVPPPAAPTSVDRLVINARDLLF